MPQPGAGEPACRGARVAAMSSQKLSITWVAGQRWEAESSAAAGVKETALRGVSRQWDPVGWAGGLAPNPPDPSDGVFTPRGCPGTSWGQPYPSGPAPPRYHLTPRWSGWHLDKHVFLWPNCSRFQAVRKILSGAPFPRGCGPGITLEGPPRQDAPRGTLRLRTPFGTKSTPGGCRGPQEGARGIAGSSRAVSG